jgi:sulfite reductase alpha subunit-like flavoprotein
MLTVLYGSQTGTAQEIAKNISADAAAKGMKSQVCGIMIALCLLLLAEHWLKDKCIHTCDHRQHA